MNITDFVPGTVFRLTGATKGYDAETESRFMPVMGMLNGNGAVHRQFTAADFPATLLSVQLEEPYDGTRTMVLCTVITAAGEVCTVWVKFLFDTVTIGMLDVVKILRGNDQTR